MSHQEHVRLYEIRPPRVSAVVLSTKTVENVVYALRAAGWREVLVDYPTGPPFEIRVHATQPKDQGDGRQTFWRNTVFYQEVGHTGWPKDDAVLQVSTLEDFQTQYRIVPDA